MKRRDFVALVTGAAATWSLAAYAQQQPRVWRVGILSARQRAREGELDNFSFFVKGMQELGYTEGRNLKLERRYANAPEELPRLASELVKAQVDVVVTTGSPAVSAAYQATKTIPIVSASFNDPVASGFAQSLARPGRNITGLSNLGDEMYIKRLEILHTLVPKAKRIGWLVNPANPATSRSLPSLQVAARSKGSEIVVFNIGSVQQLDESFALMSKARIDAVIVADETFFNSRGKYVAELTLRHRMPAIYGPYRTVEAGGLVSYGLDPGPSLHRTATFVHKILNGAKAGDLPIEQPTNFDLAINRKTAKALGIAVPQELLLRANRVIE